jgi:hypothetical protein
MKKFIILFAAAGCLTFTQAQSITKFYGSLYPSTKLLDLEVDSVFRYPTSYNVLQVQMYFGFKFTNGNVEMKAGDTIKVIGMVINMPFTLGSGDTVIYILDEDLSPGATTDIIDAAVFEGSSVQIPMNPTFSSILNTTKIDDSTHRLPNINYHILYASRYNIPPTSPIKSKLVSILLVKKQQPIGAVSESVMEKVKFYPNPVSNELNITNLKDINIWIYNVVGQQIIKQENISGNISIDMREYPEGVYFVKLQNGKSVRTEKIKVVK